MKTIYHGGYRRLIAELRRLRLELGLTLDDVCSQLGRCRTWLCKIEQYELRLDVLYFTGLCAIYGVEPAALLKLLKKEETT